LKERSNIKKNKNKLGKGNNTKNKENIKIFEKKAEKRKYTILHKPSTNVDKS